MSFIATNFILPYVGTDKVLKIQNSALLKVGGFNVCQYIKSATEAKELIIFTSLGQLVLDFATESDAKLAQNLLNIAIESLVTNCSLGGGLASDLASVLAIGNNTMNQNIVSEKFNGLLTVADAYIEFSWADALNRLSGANAGLVANDTKLVLNWTDASVSAALTFLATEATFTHSVRNVFDAPNNNFPQEAADTLAYFDTDQNLKSIILGNGLDLTNGTLSLTTSAVQSVTGTLVDNTDPLNPIINTPIFSTPSLQDVVTVNNILTSFTLAQSPDGKNKIDIDNNNLRLRRFNPGSHFSYILVNNSEVEIANFDFVSGQIAQLTLDPLGGNILDNSVKNKFTAPIHEFNNKVGIGTSTPNAMLDIASVGSGTIGLNLNTTSTQDAKLYFRTNNAATARSQIYLDNTAQTLNVYTVNNDTIFWNGNGLAQTKTLTLLTDTSAKFENKVGIGVVPTYQLDIQGATQATIRTKVTGAAATANSLFESETGNVVLDLNAFVTAVGTSGGSKINFNHTGSTIGTIYTNTANSRFSIESSYDVQLYNNNGLQSVYLGSGGIYFGTTSVNRMIVADSGRVGIGTTTPAELLEVSGNLKLTTTSNVFKIGAYNALSITQGAGGSNIIIGHGNTMNDADNGGGIVIGTFATSSSDGIAIGLSSVVALNTVDGIAIGREATVNNGAIRGIAIGREALSSNNNAIAIGNYTTASQADTIIIGNNSSGPKPFIGIGTSSPTANFHLYTNSNSTSAIIRNDQYGGLEIQASTIPAIYLSDYSGTSTMELWGYHGAGGVIKVKDAFGWRNKNNNQGIASVVNVDTNPNWVFAGAFGNAFASSDTRFRIVGEDTTSANYAVKIDNSAVSLLHIRNDHFIDANVNTQYLRILSTTATPLTPAFSIFDSGYGEAFRSEGYYGRNYMGLTSSDFNKSATLNIGTWGLGRFLNFGTDGNQATFADADGTGIIFTGKQKTLATTEFKLVSDEGLLVSNNNTTAYFRRNVDVGGNGAGDAISRVYIVGETSDATKNALTAVNLGGTSLLYAKNDGEIGMNGFTIRQLSSYTIFKTSGTNGYLFNNAADNTNLARLTNVGVLILNAVTALNSNVGLSVKAQGVSNSTKEFIAELYKGTTNNTGVTIASKEGVVYVQGTTTANGQTVDLILGAYDGAGSQLENIILKSNGGINVSTLQTGNAGLSSGDLYVDTAANILANGDLVVGRKV